MAEALLSTTVKAMAAILTTTPEELRDLSAARVLPKIERGNMPQIETIQAYTRYLRERPMSTVAAGQEIGVTGQFIRQLIGEGAIKKHGRNVRLIEVLKGYIGWLKDDARRNSKSASATRVADARALEIEIRTAERRRELIPVEDAQAAMDAVVGRCLTEMVGLPASYTRDIAERRRLEEKMDGCRARIAASLRNTSEALVSGGDVLKAADPGDAG